MNTPLNNTKTPAPGDENSELLLKKTAKILVLLTIFPFIASSIILVWILKYFPTLSVSMLKILTHLDIYFILALIVITALLLFSLIWTSIALVTKKSYWKNLGYCSLVLLLSIFSLIIFLNATRQFRHDQFEALADRSKPLIDAIEKFNFDSGRYPLSLEELVPAYLPEVPGTGIPFYPRYQYSFADAETPYKKYELLVPCSNGILNWDVFFYWPERNYPVYIYGGVAEKIKDWAYVHE